MESRKEALAWWRALSIEEQKDIVEQDEENKMPFGAVSASSQRIEKIFKNLRATQDRIANEIIDEILAEDG